MTPYGDMDLGTIGSGNGLLPSGTKPFSEPMLTISEGLWHSPKILTIPCNEFAK